MYRALFLLAFVLISTQTLYSLPENTLTQERNFIYKHSRENSLLNLGTTELSRCKPPKQGPPGPSGGGVSSGAFINTNADFQEDEVNGIITPGNPIFFFDIDNAFGTDIQLTGTPSPFIQLHSAGTYHVVFGVVAQNGNRVAAFTINGPSGFIADSILNIGQGNTQTTSSYLIEISPSDLVDYPNTDFPTAPAGTYALLQLINAATGNQNILLSPTEGSPDEGETTFVSQSAYINILKVQ